MLLTKRQEMVLRGASHDQKGAIYDFEDLFDAVAMMELYRMGMFHRERTRSGSYRYIITKRGRDIANEVGILRICPWGCGNWYDGKYCPHCDEKY